MQGTSAHHPVFVESDLSEVFSRPAEAAQPVVVHLEQPVLRGNKALCKEKVGFVFGRYVRYAPAIAKNLCPADHAFQVLLRLDIG